MIIGCSVLTKYYSLWPFQSNKNVNLAVKNLIPIEHEVGNYFDCEESARPTKTYEIRNGKVYFDFFTLDSADEASFNTFGRGDIFAKDKNFVYAYGTALPNIDTNSFKFLSDYFIKDKNGVYFFSLTVLRAYYKL